VRFNFFFVFFCASQVIASDYEAPFSISSEKVQIEVQADGRSSILESRCYKVQTLSAISYLGERRLTFISSMENLDVIEAYTLQSNGLRTPVSKDRILLQDGDGESESVIHTDVKSYVIVYPRAEVGSELCYTSKNIQSKPYFERHFSWTRHFNPHINHEGSEVTITAAPEAGIRVDSKGTESNPPYPLSDGRIRWHFRFRSEVAHPREPDQVNFSDFAPFISVSTLKNYSELAKAYQSGVVNKTQPSEAINGLVKTLTKDLLDDKSKASAIHNWVSQNIRYLGIYWADGGYVPHTATEVFQNRYGDCKDHALLLEVMLKIAGIESTPVLIYSGKRFVLPNLPVITAFNHVITYIPSLDLYLDSTAQFAPLGTLPTSTLDKFALHVADGKIHKTRPGNPQTESTLTMSKFDLNADGSFTGEAKSMANGGYDYQLRSIRFGDQGRTQEALTSRYMGRYMETGIGNIEGSNPSDLSQFHRVHSSFVIEPIVNVPGPSAFALPTGMAVGWIRGTSMKERFQEASYSFICPPHRHFEQLQITVPKGTKVVRLPKDVKVQLGPFGYSARYTKTGNAVRAERLFVMNTKSHVCDASLNTEFNAVLKSMRRDMRSQIFIE
jgi:hypothetical protein